MDLGPVARDVPRVADERLQQPRAEDRRAFPLADIIDKHLPLVEAGTRLPGMSVRDDSPDRAAAAVVQCLTQHVV